MTAVTRGLRRVRLGRVIGDDPQARKKGRIQDPVKRAAYWQRWYAKNKERHKAETRAYHLVNRERVIVRQREYNKTRVKEKRAQAKMWRESFPQEKKARDRATYLANPGKYKTRAAERRAKVRGATVGDRVAIAAYYRSARTRPRIKCAHCGRTTVPRNRHIDHIIPLSRGGRHEVLNFQITHARCNLSKGAKLQSELTGQHALELRA